MEEKSLRLETFIYIYIYILNKRSPLCLLQLRGQPSDPAGMLRQPQVSGHIGLRDAKRPPTPSQKEAFVYGSSAKILTNFFSRRKNTNHLEAKAAKAQFFHPPEPCTRVPASCEIDLELLLTFAGPPLKKNLSLEDATRPI